MIYCFHGGKHDLPRGYTRTPARPSGSLSCPTNPSQTTLFKAPDRIRRHEKGGNGESAEPPDNPLLAHHILQQLPTHIPNKSDKNGNTPAYTAKQPPGKT
jgi:hypothetical protein